MGAAKGRKGRRRGPTGKRGGHLLVKKTGKGLLEVAGKALKVLGAEKLKDLAGYAINRAIDIIPGELHIPGYNFCGPGTKLAKRLARGDMPVNRLDESCKKHDIAYSRYSDNTRRSEADRILQEEAWKRVGASDSSLAEKAAALVVTNAIKAKRAIGGGYRKTHNKRKQKTLKKKIGRRRVV